MQLAWSFEFHKYPLSRVDKKALGTRFEFSPCYPYSMFHIPANHVKNLRESFAVSIKGRYKAKQFGN